MSEQTIFVNAEPIPPNEEGEAKKLPIGWDAIPIYFVPDVTARQFGHNQENRKINAKHVKQIKRDWKRSNGLIPPITINWNTKNIIDGQHRLQAFLELIDEGVLNGGVDGDKILVRFVKVEPSEEKQLIIDANTKSKNWSQNDYIESHSATKEDYKKLIEWCSNHPLCVDEKGKPKLRYGAAMVKGKGCGGILKNGKFSATEEEWNNAETIYNTLVELIELLELESNGTFIEPLAVEWSKREKDLSKKMWFSAFKKNKSAVIKMPRSNRKNWQAIFDFIYSKTVRDLDKKQKVVVKED